jgi:tetratricopeptide (TPR) repeat protein
MSDRALQRALALAMLATLAACSTLEGTQRPAPSRPSAGRAVLPPSQSPAAPNGSAAPPAAPESAPPSVAAPVPPPRETAGATQALLAQSRAARSAGNYAQANATIERALRIAPSDAALWVELGEIELATGNAAQAATLARKALTLAADDSAAIAGAQRLLRAAGGH